MTYREQIRKQNLDKLKVIFESGGQIKAMVYKGRERDLESKRRLHNSEGWTQSLTWKPLFSMWIDSLLVRKIKSRLCVELVRRRQGEGVYDLRVPSLRSFPLKRFVIEERDLREVGIVPKRHF